MRSMTGFGAGDSPLGEGRLSLELRAQNHRYLEVRVRLPPEIADQQSFLEQLARERLSRGRIDLGVRLGEGATPPPRFSKARARALYAALSELSRELSPGAELPVAALAHFPEHLVEVAPTAGDEVRAAIRTAFVNALAALDQMRETEGQALRVDLGARLEALSAWIVSVRAASAGVVERERSRLRARIEALLDGSAPIDPARLETEIVLFADKSDTSEELTRIESHFEQFRRTLDTEGPIGRKLDFLLQEIAREMNTLGAKSTDAGVAHRVVDAKTELERIREQVQNVE